MPKRVVISWSGGKDSAWVLHTLRRHPNDYRVLGLLTTVNQEFNRVAMHGVRRELVEAQAQAAGLPLWVVPLPFPCTNEHYERRMRNALHFMRTLGIDSIAFGDLYLEDIRRYREQQFGNCGLDLLFPIWGIPTRELSTNMLAAGFKARLTCVDPRAVPSGWVGREFDARLISELPPTTDPCAENGEFHTFVYEAPIFRTSIPIVSGENVERDGFVFADLRLAPNEQSAERSSEAAILAG